MFFSVRNVAITVTYGAENTSEGLVLFAEELFKLCGEVFTCRYCRFGATVELLLKHAYVCQSLRVVFNGFFVQNSPPAYISIDCAMVGGNAKDMF
jgi:hypothetical protein